MPYRYERFGIDFHVSSCRVDGEIRDDQIDSQGLHVDITRQRDWDTLELDISLNLPRDVVEQVFPEEEHSSPPGEIIILVQCDKTFLRESHTVADESPSGCHTITLSIPLSDLRDEVMLKPYLVRTQNTSDHSQFGTEIGSRLASSREWTVAIDEDDSSNGGYLNAEYRSFSDWDRQEIRDEQIYHLDVDAGTEPTLWLNIDHNRIYEIMDNEGSRGRAPRIRDLIYDYIGQGVWTKLFLHAAAEVDENGDAFYDWQTAVLDQLIPKMYPESDTEAALESIRTDVQIENDPSNAIGRLNSVLQTEIDNRSVYDHLVKLIEEVMD